MSGHGVSDAVRQHIPVWTNDDALVEKMYETWQTGHAQSDANLKQGGYGSLPVFRARIRRADSWKRVSRSKTGSGWERQFHCKEFPGDQVALIVHSPTSDYSADAYAFKVDGKLIAGGKTSLKAGHGPSVNEKTLSHAAVERGKENFVKMTQEQLLAIQHRMEYGDGFEDLETERIA